MVKKRLRMILFASDQWKHNSSHLQQQQQTGNGNQTKSSRDVSSSNHVKAADTLSQLRGQLPANHLSNHMSTWSPAHHDNQLLPAPYNSHCQVTAPTRHL